MTKGVENLEKAGWDKSSIKGIGELLIDIRGSLLSAFLL